MIKKIVASVFILIILFSCDIRNNSVSNKALEYSPYAPEIVSGSNASNGMRSLEDQDFGPFGQIKYSAYNYDSMIDGTVPNIMQDISSSEVEATDLYPYTNKLTTSSSQFYYNDDYSITTALNVNVSEYRQFDAFIIPNEEYKYSRCYFYWPEGQGKGVDVTEVWEYNDRKEVSVTMYNAEYESAIKFLSVTNILDDNQKTSLLEGAISISSSESFNIKDYSSIGYIDFSMAATEYIPYDTDIWDNEDSYLVEGCLPFSYLKDLHEKSVSMSDVNLITLNENGLGPYTGFFD